MVSVIVPVYNVESYLEKCIRSILTNTYKDLEIICINDGSKDNSLQILKCLAEEDSRIRIINQVNQGVQIARNNGIKAAKGEFIAFVDSDDWIHPQYFKTLLHCMETKNANIVICGCQTFSEREKISVICYDHVQYNRISSKQFFKSYYARHMVWGRLYRKKDLEGTWFMPEVQYADDTLYNLTVAANSINPIVFETSAPLYFYLQRNDSITKTISYQKMIQLPDWVFNNRDYIIDRDWSWMLILQAIKMSLSFRYGGKLYKRDEEIEHANIVLKTLLLRILEDRNISIYEKIIHLIVVMSHRVYRTFRVLQDPTLLTWEKSVKMQLKYSKE